MRIGLKIILTLFLLITTYAGFLWVTYLDDVITSGEKYGFTIGATKLQSYKNISVVKDKHQKLVIYLTTGPRAGNQKILLPTQDNYEHVEKYGHWELLLDGEGEFFNVIRLSFTDDKLTEIYRHRKYFELP